MLKDLLKGFNHLFIDHFCVPLQPLLEINIGKLIHEVSRTNQGAKKDQSPHQGKLLPASNFDQFESDTSEET